jgi:D-alanine-D-alanine ligase
MKKKVIILHNLIQDGDNPDEKDVLDQRDLVRDACLNLGYEVKSMEVGNDIFADISLVAGEKPDLVFNLVEASFGKGELIYFAPAILNSLKVQYTGVPLDALFLTTNKLLAKKTMQMHNIPTAAFFRMKEISKLDKGRTYIVKPIWEEGSVGIDDAYIFSVNDEKKRSFISRLPESHYFIEEFIDGREFNVGMLAGKDGFEILPIAEMIFTDFFSDKYRILGYKAKWDEESGEYKNTYREFGTLESGSPLEMKLRAACEMAWKVFGLKGYARVDFRVDKDENVYVLEINGNPCISPDSGFVAAVLKAGYTMEIMIERILNDLN